MRKSNKKIKVLCAMSGGVDSSVAAALLVAKGYDVTGAFMVNYEDEITRIKNEDYPDFALAQNRGSAIPTQSRNRDADSKCWTGDYQDALRVAAKLGISLIRLDFKKEYKKSVLDYMYKEYRAGRTPNPDVLCNKFVKFGAWLDKARELGFDKLATGHYARVEGSKEYGVRSKRTLLPTTYHLLPSADANKDQTYFLHQLNQEQLKHVLFPIGGYTKPEVRKLAKKLGLSNADKEESMGICFVGEVPMKEFLQKKIKPRKGKIILSTGEVIGEHDGLPFYTIGQRNMGVKTKANKPLYVVAKNFAKNELVVGYEDDPLLYKKTAEVPEVNWVGGKQPKLPLNCEARLRHRQPLQKCMVQIANSKLIVKFSTPQRAVTPGQFAVFYKNGECLGGGVIE